MNRDEALEALETYYRDAERAEVETGDSSRIDAINYGADEEYLRLVSIAYPAKADVTDDSGYLGFIGDPTRVERFACYVLLGFFALVVALVVIGVVWAQLPG